MRGLYVALLVLAPPAAAMAAQSNDKTNAAQANKATAATPAQSKKGEQNGIIFRPGTTQAQGTAEVEHYIEFALAVASRGTAINAELNALQQLVASTPDLDALAARIPQLRSQIDEAVAEVTGLRPPTFKHLIIPADLAPAALRASQIDQLRAKQATLDALEALIAAAKNHDDQRVTAAANTLFLAVRTDLAGQRLSLRTERAASPSEDADDDIIQLRLLTIESLQAIINPLAENGIDRPKPVPELASQLRAFADEADRLAESIARKLAIDIEARKNEAHDEVPGDKRMKSYSTALIEVARLEQGLPPLARDYASRLRQLAATLPDGPLDLQTVRRLVQSLSKVRLDIETREAQALQQLGQARRE